MLTKEQKKAIWAKLSPQARANLFAPREKPNPNDPIVKARRQLKRQVKIALVNNSTVPYRLDQLLDAGLSNDTIRRVYRPNNPNEP